MSDPNIPAPGSLDALMGLSNNGQPSYSDALRTLQEMDQQLTAQTSMRSTLLCLLNSELARRGLVATIDARGGLSISGQATPLSA